MQELKTRWRELARRYDVRTDNAAFAASVGARALPGAGFGIAPPSATASASQGASSATRPLPKLPAAPPPPAEAPPAPEHSPKPEAKPQAEPEPPPVTGVVLRPVTPPEAPPPSWPWRSLGLGVGLAAIAASGAWHQRHQARRGNRRKKHSS